MRKGDKLQRESLLLSNNEENYSKKSTISKAGKMKQELTIKEKSLRSYLTLIGLRWSIKEM